jgi:hypothetical protein
MKADPEDFRRLYSSLNDEALLALNREDLVPIAQQCYDVEVNARGLGEPAEEVEETAAATPGAPGPDLVEVAAFQDPSEASLARSLLRSAEIPCVLSSDLPLVSSGFAVLADIKLYVPAEFVEAANEILDHEMSDEELAAQAEAAGLSDMGEIEEEEEEATESEE